MKKSTWFQIRTDPNFKKKAETLALEMKLDLSKMIRSLIEKAWNRRHPTSQENSK